MKFKILSATIEVVNKPGSEQDGKKYVKIVVAEDSMFAQKEHNVVLFVGEELIKLWEKAIADNSFPPFFATYKTVEYPAIPMYKLKDRDNGIVYKAMTVLVPQTADGQDRVSAVTLANSTIKERMLMVSDAPDVPVADTVVPQ